MRYRAKQLNGGTAEQRNRERLSRERQAELRIKKLRIKRQEAEQRNSVRYRRRAHAPYDGSSQSELTTAPLRGYDGVRLTPHYDGEKLASAIGATPATRWVATPADRRSGDTSEPCSRHQLPPLAPLTPLIPLAPLKLVRYRVYSIPAGTLTALWNLGIDITIG